MTAEKAQEIQAYLATELSELIESAQKHPDMVVRSGCPLKEGIKMMIFLGSKKTLDMLYTRMCQHELLTPIVKEKEED